MVHTRGRIFAPYRLTAPSRRTAMAEYVVKVGSRSAQGRRPNNEDRFIADPDHNLFLVADGMGGQDFGEKASGLAAEIIPRVLQENLSKHQDAENAVRSALDQ